MELITHGQHYYVETGNAQNARQVETPDKVAGFNDNSIIAYIFFLKLSIHSGHPKIPTCIFQTDSG